MVLPTIGSIAGIAIVWVTGERRDMGDKPSALAAMQRGGDADLDPKLVGSVGLGFGYNLASCHNRNVHHSFYNNFFRNTVRIA